MDTSVQYVQGIMFAASAFIAIAGIIFTIGINQKSLSTKWLVPIYISIAIGAASIVTALGWLSSPSDNEKLVAQFCLFAQFVLWYFPSAALFASLKYKKDIQTKR